MRLSLFFLCSLVALLLIGQNAYAQTDVAGKGSPVENSNTIEINEGELKGLIDTLENEASRNEFIENLKTLTEVEQKKQQDEALLDLSQATSGFIARYEAFVSDLGISEGLFSQIAATTVIILVWCFFVWLVRRLAHVLRDRLLRVKERYQLSHDRFRLYARYVRYAGYIIVTSIALYTLSFVWNLTEGDMTIGVTGQTILINILNIFVVTLVAIIIWEIISTSIEHYIKKLDTSHSSRMLTIIPIIRNVIFVAFIILFALVLLSEIGVNIVPLMAGAGVLGIAIGLGAQTMIKDFLTGFTIILEDLIQVGDVANVGGKLGVIEKITIRKIQLRDVAGIVYTVPFSEVTVVENWTKDFSFYIMDIGVAYRENTDEVIEYLKEVDEDLRNDPDFKDLILEPLEILGVDAFADSAVIIKARIKTLPIKQWLVGREFNRRMKYKFDEKGVEIPFPHQTLYFGEDKQGKAPAAPIKIIEGESKDKEKKKGNNKPSQKTEKKKKSNTEEGIGETK